MTRPDAHKPPDVQITWDGLSWEKWEQELSRAPASYQQDWSYGRALSQLSPTVKILRACVRRADGSVVALAQIVSRPFAMIARFALCTHGPAWIGEVSREEKCATYRALRKTMPLGWPKLLVITPDESREDSAGLKGMSRVMTGDATVLLDLEKSEEQLRAAMDQGWRNRLSKAERAGLVVQKGGLKPAQYRWLLDAEARQRQKRGYRAMPLEMTERWQESKSEAARGDKGAGLAVYRVDSGRDPAAAMLFLIHGQRATYHVGWTSEEGRNTAAHNLILWTAMKDLKARGIRVLDLGGVNTQSGAGIARFKLETGGRVLERAGAYV